MKTEMNDKILIMFTRNRKITTTKRIRKENLNRTEILKEHPEKGECIRREEVIK